MILFKLIILFPQIAGQETKKENKWLIQFLKMKKKNLKKNELYIKKPKKKEMK